MLFYNCVLSETLYSGSDLYYGGTLEDATAERFLSNLRQYNLQSIYNRVYLELCTVDLIFFYNKMKTQKEKYNNKIPNPPRNHFLAI